MKKMLVVLMLSGLVLAQPMPIVINEIMYNSPGPDKEWIELYNRGGISITLDSTWVLKDNYGSYSFSSTLSGDSVTIDPGSFLTVFVHPHGLNDSFTLYFAPDVDASGHNIQLHNDSDIVVLYTVIVDGMDTIVVVIDSVSYYDDWGPMSDNEGSSLERIDPHGPSNDSSNWGASIDSLGTPGRQNSLSAVVKDAREYTKLKINVFPNPFNSACVIESPLPGDIQIFDCTGKMVSVLRSNEQKILWKPHDLKSGIYFIKHTKTNTTATLLFLQ